MIGLPGLNRKGLPPVLVLFFHINTGIKGNKWTILNLYGYYFHMTTFKEDWFFHIESDLRRYPEGREVQSAGYFAHKKEWIKHSFQTLNFSFILSGRGYYELDGKLLAVKAPMVLTQSPGVPMNYGPEGEWEELFIIYPCKQLSYFSIREILDKQLWKIQQHSEIIRQIRDILYQLQNQERLKSSSDFFDRIDLSIEQLILYSRQESVLPRETELQLFVQDLYMDMEQDPFSEYDFHALAEERGFSPSSFRRCWEELYERPPGQELIEIKIRRACRLLAETELPVRTIAGNLGYDDPLYFSRIFKKKRSESPAAYRKRTRAPYLSSSGSLNQN